MKNPSPPPAWVPPPEIISAASTTSHVIPIPTAAPVKIEGRVPGSTMRQKSPHCDAPMDCAARR